MVTRSSLLLVMTGIAAGIAGGWFWSRARSDLHVQPPVATEARSEPIRSPFTQRREERATYLTETADERNSEPASSSAGFSQRRALYESASEADRDRIEELIAQARSIPNPLERRSSLEILLLRYAELDVNGAIDEALESDRETAKHLLAALATVAPEQAWERTLRVANPAERLVNLRAVVVAWTAQDPQRAFEKVSELPDDWQRAELLQSVTLGIADRDPRLAISLAESQPPAVSRTLIDMIALQWGRNNPSEAARWVEGLSRTDQARYAYRIAEAYVAQKPEEALAWALRLAGSPERYLWSTMLGHIARHDPQRALSIAQSADSPAQRAQAMGAVLGAIAQTNPSLAMAELQRIPAGSMRRRVLQQIAGAVASFPPTAALDWLNGIEDNRTQLQAAQALGWQLAQRNVEAAAQLVDRVPAAARESWISAVAMAYATSDVEKGRQWIRRYGNEANGLSVQFASAVAQRSPEAAIEFVQSVSDDRERDRLLSGMMSTLAQHAPELAATWAEKMTDEQQRQRAMAEVAGTWSQYDMSAAQKWVLSLNDGPAKEQALSTLVQQATTLDEALPILNQIQTPERRSHAVLMAAMSLSRRDMEEARTLLRRYPLDPARQRQFEEFTGRRNRGR